MADKEVNLEELISALKHSSAPTLIVEGRDDYVAFGEFEIENVTWGLTILPVYGQGNVEKIIERAAEIRHPALAFLLDRDCTVFAGPPDHLIRPDTFFTDGYAIENDLIRDGDIPRLLHPNERIGFQTELAALARFLACAASRHVAQHPTHALSTHPHQLFGKTTGLLPEYRTFVEAEEANLHPTYRQTLQEPLRYVRGKNLLGLLARHLGYSQRRSKYSSANLLEIGGSLRGPHITVIESNVLSYFRELGLAPKEPT